MKNIKYIVLIFIFVPKIWAQKKDENIGTEVVNVVKAYTPTISDAFKIKEIPSLDDEVISKKETVKYTIFSFPVASTFTPSKGSASKVEKEKQEKYFANYATLAAGNYGTAIAELFLTHSLENDDYIGLNLNHHSSTGGLKEVDLKNSFSDSKLDFTYGSRTSDMNWNVDLGFKNENYNWYGLEKNLAPTLVLDNINPKQSYNNAYFGGRIDVKESTFKEAFVKFNRFWDAFDSAENQFVVKPKLEFDILDQKVKTEFSLDYINGKFKNDYTGLNAINYSYTNFAVSPSIVYKTDDLVLNAGISAVYSAGTNANKFYLYPNILASYKLVGDLMIGYAGAEGGLTQNSYQNFAQKNVFVSPTLEIVPTDKRFDVFVGLKGKLASTVSYNVSGSLANEGSKALFKSNLYNSGLNLKGYQFGNSFSVVYDDIKTLSFTGQLNADFSKNVSFSLKGTFNSYTLGVQSQAWNLPSIEVESSLYFKIAPKWYAKTNLFFVGERKDQYINLTLANPVNDVKLDSYFDLNLFLGFNYSERLSFFIKGNNIANQAYPRWSNYPVQGAQALLGANYKFDF